MSHDVGQTCRGVLGGDSGVTHGCSGLLQAASECGSGSSSCSPEWSSQLEFGTNPAGTATLLLLLPWGIPRPRWALQGVGTAGTPQSQSRAFLSQPPFPTPRRSCLEQRTEGTLSFSAPLQRSAQKLQHLFVSMLSNPGFSQSRFHQNTNPWELRNWAAAIGVSSVAVPWLGFPVRVAGRGWAMLPQPPFPPYNPSAAAGLIFPACHYPHPCQIHLLFSPEDRNLSHFLVEIKTHKGSIKFHSPLLSHLSPGWGLAARSLGHSGHVGDHGVIESYKTINELLRVQSIIKSNPQPRSPRTYNLVRTTGAMSSTQSPLPALSSPPGPPDPIPSSILTPLSPQIISWLMRQPRSTTCTHCLPSWRALLWRMWL